MILIKEVNKIYSMRSFSSEKTRAAVLFILTSMVLAVAAFFYIKLYYSFRAADGNIIAKFQANLQNGAIFLALSVCWLVMWFSSMVKYRRIRRAYGPFFGAVLGRFLLLFELVGYALVMVFLLV